MLILLPPSEGKSAPARGRPLDLSGLGSPALTPARTAVLEALTELCGNRPEDAARVLGLGSSQSAEVRRNAALRTAPTARAERVYTGVLYAALGLGSLDTAARRRAGRWLAVTSSVFGLLRPADRIPAYRLAGDVTLPGIGAVAAHWRSALGPAMGEAAGDGVVLDLRSGTYQAFWRPGRDLSARTLTARVVQERGGTRTVASHFNKATKGRLVASLLTSGAAPRTPRALVGVLGDLGWQVEAEGSRLDVVVDEL